MTKQQIKSFEKNRKKQLGKLLVDIRTAKGKSKNQMIMDSKMQWIMIDGVESGKSNYTIDTLLRYLDTIGVEIKFVEKQNNEI